MLTIQYDYRNLRQELKLIKEILTRPRDKKTRRREVAFQILGSLSKGVFKRRTSTGSEAFSL